MSDNIYYFKKFRFSIDTLYVGLQIDDLCVTEFLDKIKNYLFFWSTLEIDTDFCRNRFYEQEMVKEDCGFFMFVKPRRNCLNPMITLQLTGTFFKWHKQAKKFIDWLFQEYYGLVDFQRVDVAVDCYMKKSDYTCDYDYHFDNEKNFPRFFPFVDYSPEWKNRKIPFEVYGRIIGETVKCNMMFQGKNDFRIRIYDKTLDLLDKYNSTYKNFYQLKISDDDCFQVYRIETQMRGDKLKAFIDSCNSNELTFIDCYANLVNAVIFYTWKKYQFRFIKQCPVKFETGQLNLNMNHKVETTVDGRIRYNRNMMLSYYKKYQDCCDEKSKLCKSQKEIEKLCKVRMLTPYQEYTKGMLDLELASQDRVPF